MEDITVAELKYKMDKGDNFVFIDVREPYEFEQFNLGARLIPLGELEATLPELKDYKDTEVIVHCKSGVRSGFAKQIMLAAGFSRVRNLLGGVMEWQRVY